LGPNCFEFLWDEGLFVIEDLMPGLSAPVAMVCIAEKGVLDVSLSISTEPGHSSNPPSETSIGILAKAVKRLEDNPMHGACFPTDFVCALTCREYHWDYSSCC
jgi:carboxypeptidase PM20D1